MLNERDFAEFKRGSLQMIVLYLLREGDKQGCQIRPSDQAPQQGEVFRGNPDGLQGKLTQYGGKKTVQTVFNGCEYRF